MKHHFVLALALVLPSCLSMHARAYAGLTKPSVAGDFALQNTAGTLDLGANLADLNDEFGIEDSETLPYVRGELGIPIGSVTVSGFGFSQTGSGLLAATHQFGDIPAGSAISTRLQFLNVKAAVHFDLVNFGPVRLSPGLGVNVFDVDAEVRQASTPNFEQVDNLAPVPMLFAQGEVDLGIVAGTLDAGWMSADLKDADGTYFDIEALVRVNPLPHLELFAGYRYISLDAKGTASDRRYEADLQLHGWMLGGGVTF